MSSTTRQLGFVALALAGASATFVLNTITMDLVPDAVLVAAALLGAFLLVAAAYGARGLHAVRADVADVDVLLAAGAGVLAFWAAPLLALSQRATDSPSGTDAVMLMTAAWGALTILVAFVSAPRAVPYVVPAASVAGLFGAAAILANWERPSSLNLFVKATDREVVIVLAGAVFAVGALRLARAVAKLGLARASVASVGAATTVGLLFALPSLLGAMPQVAAHAITLTMLGLAYGAFCVGWLGASRGRTDLPAVSLLLVPAALTALSALERRIGVAGPNPIVWSGVAAGVVLCAAAAVVILLSQQDASKGLPALSARQKSLVAVAGLAVTLAAVALLLPAIQATSEGILGDGFHATWAMLGFETAAGWMPLVASLLGLAALLDLFRSGARASLVAASLAALAAIFTVPTLAAVPLHTWTTWIPPDVQQTYGTEYARLTTEPLTSPVAILALVLAGAVAVVVLVLALRRTSSVDRDNVSEEGT